MEKDILDILATHKIFSSLDSKTLRTLAPKFTKISVDQGKFLFKQGEPATDVYLLISGKLASLLTYANNKIKTISRLAPFDMIGEVSVLANEPRSLSIKATQPSVLYKLSSKDFIELCNTYPAVMVAAIHPVITQTQKIIHLLSSEETDKHLILIPANKQVDIAIFIEKFTHYVSSLESIIFISDFLPEFDHKHQSITKLKEKISHIENNKKSSQKIIYLLQSHDTALAKIVLPTADVIYLIAHSQSPAYIDPPLVEIIEKQSRFNTLSNLILLHPDTTLRPTDTAIWLAQIQFNMHYHLQLNNIKHYKRLLRFMRGKAVGLVLGGGGTRGWAHLGAIKAIRERKIPIDFIGGTSVGAIIASSYAMQESYEDAFNSFSQIIKAARYSVSWRSLTWPIISIFNGKSFTESLTTTFDQIKIEDLWLPYFCISSNLTKNNVEIHRHGLLSLKTRASASIPGLIPPTLIEGELHFDGGLLNNLPVDVMQQFIGKKGKIIAVELTSTLHDYHKYHFLPVMTLKQVILNKLGYENYKYPRFMDTFLRGLLIGASSKARENGLAATVLVNLNLNKFRLLHSSAKQAEKIFEVGYKETLHQINLYKNKNI